MASSGENLLSQVPLGQPVLVIGADGGLGAYALQVRFAPMSGTGLLAEELIGQRAHGLHRSRVIVVAVALREAP